MKKQTHGSSNCYSIQEGRIIEKRHPKSRYISPARTKNKNLCPLFPNTSTPLGKRIFQQQKKSNTTESSSDDTDANTLSGNHYENRLNDIVRREKKNPLASTRLSCYTPKLSGGYNLQHCKSVDDFLFLNVDDTSSTFSSDITTLIKDHQDNWEHATIEPKTAVNTDETSELCAEKSMQYMNASNTKNIETMASKKKIVPGNLSERFKTMSNRTQKIFSRLYKQHQSTNGKDFSTSEAFGGSKSKPASDENQSNFQIGSSSRRSLSYGNLPALDHFQRNLEFFEKNVIKIDIKDGTLSSEGVDSDSVYEQTNQKDAQTEDGDSGIFGVNESGQSSIVVVEPEETEPVVVANANRKINDPIDNPKLEYKFVQLHLGEDDVDRSLRVVLSPQYFDNGERMGYQVADIIPGGLIDR